MVYLFSWPYTALAGREVTFLYLFEFFANETVQESTKSIKSKASSALSTRLEFRYSKSGFRATARNPAPSKVLRTHLIFPTRRSEEHPQFVQNPQLAHVATIYPLMDNLKKVQNPWSQGGDF